LIGGLGVEKKFFGGGVLARPMGCTYKFGGVYGKSFAGVSFFRCGLADIFESEIWPDFFVRSPGDRCFIKEVLCEFFDIGLYLGTGEHSR